MFLSERCEFPLEPCLAERIDKNSRLDIVEIARVPNMLLILFPSWLG